MCWNRMRTKRSAPSDPRLELGPQADHVVSGRSARPAGCFFKKTIRALEGSDERRSFFLTRHPAFAWHRRPQGCDQLRSDRMPSERMAAMGERQELAQCAVGLSRRARRMVWREVGTAKFRQGCRSGGAVAWPAAIGRASGHAPASGDASLTACASQCMAMIPSTAFHSDGRIRRWWATRTEWSAPSSVSFQ